MYAICEWYKCGVKKLRKDFIGSKRFCSSKCAHAFSGSRGGRGRKDEMKIKQEKVKKSGPRPRVKRQQRNRRTAAASQEVEEQIETTAEKLVI